MTAVIKATWQAGYRSERTTFRLVQNESPATGDWTIETRSVDATGKAAWSEFVTVTSTTSEKEDVAVTPQVLSGMLDAIYRS